uniref:Olfactory receptor C family, u1 n=1 Tax=Neogobius melanostomus TaxID=47308 RepID=A0A8C6S229_9GOBI
MIECSSRVLISFSLLVQFSIILLFPVMSDGKSNYTLGPGLRFEDVAANRSCDALLDSELLALQSEGHIIIGGLFPLHYVAPQLDSISILKQMTCVFSFDFRAFRWMMTMVFAVEEINRDQTLLPGLKLGYRIMDSCDHVHTSLRAFLSLLSQMPKMQKAKFQRSIVSYFATCTCLTDKQMYPSFLRTVPSDLFQVRGLVQLVTFMGWRWVGTIGTTDDYSQYGIQAFTRQFREHGGCVAFHITLPKSPSVAQIVSMMDRLQSSTARVVVVFANEGELVTLFSEVKNVSGIQWVASEAWVTASLLTSAHFQPLLEGTVGFSFPGVFIPKLNDFLLSVRPSPRPGMEFVNMFWEELFDCKLNYDPLKDDEDLSDTDSGYTDVSQVRISYNVYKAVYAISYALHRLLKCDVIPQFRSCNRESPLLFSLKTMTLLLACVFCAGSTECTKCPEYYWPDKEKVTCMAGVEEFLSYSDSMGIILVTLTLLGVSLTAVLTTVFHRFRSTPIVKANNSEISFLLLASLKLCFLCSLVFIGQPSVWTCRVRQAAFGVSFVLCLSCLLVKTIVVLLAFKANSPRSKTLRLFGPIQQRILILCTTAPQMCLCAGWLIAAPPFPFRNPDYQIVLECKEPWPPGFYLVLGYIGLLAFFCLLLAFLGRKLPDTFNEAKLISFSMLIFWAVWLSFIPAYVSSPGKFTVAVEIFAILASSFGLLVCIFVPKCYIILLQPERNVKKAMTGKFSK